MEFMHHLTPISDIFLWYDDISGAYRIPKYNLAVAKAFSHAIMSLIFLPIWGNFDSSTSPAEYKPLAIARAFLVEYLSRDEPLVMKHADILNIVDFDVESEPSKVSYT